MTRDISATLRRAVDRSATWSSDGVWRVLDDVAGAGGSARTTDWDQDAGEEWGRVVDQEGVVALVSARLPLVFVRSSAVQPDGLRRPVPEVVDVDRTDAIALRATPEALQEAFPEIASVLADAQTDFSPGGFAADDLWFLTV
jgi:hypothetical protein